MDLKSKPYNLLTVADKLDMALDDIIASEKRYKKSQKRARARANKQKEEQKQEAKQETKIELEIVDRVLKLKISNFGTKLKGISITLEEDA
jgi:hypothetical protein